MGERCKSIIVEMFSGVAEDVGMGVGGLVGTSLVEVLLGQAGGLGGRRVSFFVIGGGVCVAVRLWMLLLRRSLLDEGHLLLVPAWDLPPERHTHEACHLHLFVVLASTLLEERPLTLGPLEILFAESGPCFDFCLFYLLVL